KWLMNARLLSALRWKSPICPRNSNTCISLSYEGEQYVFGAFYIEDVLNGNGKNYSFQASPDGKLESSNTFPQITNQGIEGLTPFLSTQFVKKTSTFICLCAKI
ncbi:hypothetical protein, partial [Acutalibacter muris]|uniref:hypothetical protein n=1 Tax=Acutalibacter muris TaxID=1796620 RepID=UPI0026F3F81F